MAIGLFGALALTLTAASCGSDDNDNHKQESEEAKETTKTFSFSKVKTSTDEYSEVYDAAWGEGEVIGVFAVADGEILDKVPYITNPDGDFVPLNEGQILEGEYRETLELYAFYPYEAGEGYDTGTIGTDFNSQNDLTAESTWNPCDLLRGVGPVYRADSVPQPGEVPHFLFKHVLSNLTVYIEEATYDPETGTAPVLPESATIRLISENSSSGNEGAAQLPECFISDCAYDVVKGQITRGEAETWKAEREVWASPDSDTGAYLFPETTFILCPGDVLQNIQVFLTGRKSLNRTHVGPITLEAGKKYVVTMYVDSSNKIVNGDVMEEEAEY